MTEFYEIEVSREAKVRQRVKVRVPKDSASGDYSAEAAAKAYIEASLKAGQPVVWATEDPTPIPYSSLTAEVIGGHVTEPAPIDHLAPPEPVL